MLLERTDAITNEFTFVLAYPTLFAEGLDVRISRVLCLPCAEMPLYEGTQGGVEFPRVSHFCVLF